MSHLTQSGSTTAAATAIAANRLIKTAGAAVVTAAATDVPVGATSRAVLASESAFPYDFFGTAKIEASAAISEGDLVQPGAAGKIATRTGTNTIAGIAMEAASGDGHVISVFMIPQGYATYSPAAVGFELTVNAEAGNAVAVDIQAIDQNGNNVAAVIDGIFTVYEDEMIEAVAAEFTCAETGAGNLLTGTTTAQSRVVFQTSAAGAAQITITDVGADRVDSIPFTVEPINLTNGTYIAAGKVLDFAVFA